MKLYLGAGTRHPEPRPTLEIVSYEELPETCPACGDEGTHCRNQFAYKAGRDFGDWVRSNITGRFAAGLLDELNCPREEAEES